MSLVDEYGSAGQLFYYVACGRKDGGQPGLEKAMYGRIFLTEEGAEHLARAQNRSMNMGDKIKVYSSVAYPHKE